jgi:hypothetical protein
MAQEKERIEKKGFPEEVGRCGEESGGRRRNESKAL